MSEEKHEIRQSPACAGLFEKLQALVTERKHEYVLPEHLLFLLLDEPEILEVLRYFEADANVLKAMLEDFFDTKVPRIKSGRFMESLSFARIVHSASIHVLSAQKDVLTPLDLFVAVFEEERSHAVCFLKRNGMERFEILKALGHLPEKNRTDSKKEKTDGKGSALEFYTVNLTRLAVEGKLQELVGRDHELDSMMRILSRKKKNNPLLIGEPGVGKTSLVEGFACRIARNQVPERLKRIEIFALDMGTLVAGTKFRGEFEERLKNIVSELQKRPEAILFIDEIHTVIGSGATGGGSMDGANILKPALNSGELRCIGSSTYEEYRNHILKDKAFSRRLQKIEIAEPNDEDSLAILRGVVPYYEKHYKVRYSDEALQRACLLAKRHITDRFMPDKAIDLIDEAGAKNSLLVHPLKKIGERQIDELLAETLRLPVAKLADNDLSLLKKLETNLKKVVIEQDEAVERLVRAIKTARAGLGNREHPVGSFLFTGPTGVGKTELAKRLAAELGIELIRFDMSEYSEEYSVSKLIGSAPGYVGFEQGGLLTEQVLRKPYSILLLDEIEKAHKKIYDVLLQVMDYGFLTDNSGRKADFRNIVVIMTSNAGGGALNVRSISFAPEDVTTEHSVEAVKKQFSPEFRNRLDAIIHFKPLSRDAILKIVDKFMDALNRETGAKSITVELTESARNWFAKNGFDEKLGARPLERLIRSEITEKLADEILFGKLARGGTVSISEKNNTLEFNIKQVKTNVRRTSKRNTK